MSEFRDSYHLKSNNTQDGIDLLTRANLTGFVFPASNGWVTLVADGEQLTPNEDLIKANLGLIIHFVSAQDHGWYFSIYNGTEQISHYECMWNEEIDVEDSMLNKDELLKIVEENPQLDPFFAVTDSVERMLYPGENIDLLDNNPAYQFSQLLGLENTEWVSFDYLMNDYENGDEIYPDVTLVDGTGKYA